MEPASFAIPLTHSHAELPSPATTLCHGKEERRCPAARGHAYHLRDTPKRTLVTAYFPARLIKHHLLPIPLPYLPPHSPRPQHKQTEGEGTVGAFQGQAQKTKMTAVQGDGKSVHLPVRCLLTVTSLISIYIYKMYSKCIRL